MSKSQSKNGSPTPTGAVMVVGGGIAGMQASLDLAEQGFKVYLAEIKSAIGGKMAQLDKTFPTNDCAMCTISPNLVETGRHPNIEVLTNTEVLDVQGEAGNFTVRMRRNPRYIDLDKCVACNDCVVVCPVSVPDTFNEGLAPRKAVYKLYPQAVPNAYAIQKTGIAPCRDACPADQRAQGYIALIREGRFDDALRTIKLDNPFPGICGRVCNHRCETACNRGQLDEPVNIRALKRYVTDKVYENPRQAVEALPITQEQRVAVIGAGPCGLTAAQDLVTAGYAATVFESQPVAGGMLRLGVPEYKLPTAIIEREVQDIVDLGVDLRLNHRVENIDDLFNQGYQAVLIASGAQEGIRLPIPGADLDGVLVNIDFLRDMRLGKYQDGSLPPLGKRVLVIGGGNVAIDCARIAVRLGSQVQMACLEGKEEMPAHAWEVEVTEKEGVTIHNSRTFEQVLGDEDGRVRGVECSRVASFHFDETGRLQLEKELDSNHILECDTVIFAVGARVGLAFLKEDSGVDLSPRRTVAVDPHSFAATREGVFAAGDSITGMAFAIDAIEGGHQSASAIIRYLQGEPLQPEPKPDLPVTRLTLEEVQSRVARGLANPQPRNQLLKLPLEERISSFIEYELGYDDQSAMSEASRCLECGICSECMSCVFACGTDAIDHDMVAREETVEVGAVVLAPGYQIYQAELSEEYGLGRFPNVVTSLQFERLLSASGPTMGHVQRPSDDVTPGRVAFLQCVGSRDQNHDYCSAVCCMYAAKEATIAKEHHPELDIQVFMMDMRAFSKGYWSYFERSRDRYGIEYTRCRVSQVFEDPASNDLILHYQDEDGERHEERFDMVVLSVGMEISESVRDLGKRLDVELDDYGFCHTVQFNPLETSRNGIYAVGPFREPKDIPESVIEASGAAAAVAAKLGSARFTLTEAVEYPEEKDVSAEEPRIGVFVCHCGSNIGGFLDVPEVAQYARGLPYVVHSESTIYTCSQDSIGHITEQVIAHRLNRVIVASCTPLTHQPLFQDSIREAGLNPYLFEMVNIRNQCSWVHSNDWDTATAKAKGLVRMGVARAALLEAQHTFELPVQRSALVVGGGVAGMTAALSLAEQGFPVHLVEKEAQLGGNLRNVFISSHGKDPQQVLKQLTEQVDASDAITLHMESQVVSSSGFMGNFTSAIQHPDGRRREIEHGATILATGAQEYRGPEYAYGTDPRILTQQEFEARLHEGDDLPDSVVMVQCVGPGEKFCSRICCTVAIKNALALKAAKPDAQVTVLYRDIRSYGFNERLYTTAREQGVLFVRYDDDHRPEVSVGEDGVTVQAWEPMLKRTLALQPDLVVLSMPVVPNDNVKELSGVFKTSIDADGFFLEAHVKLRPVDFATDGVFMAGMAHYPKLIDESMIQAQAAASRAARVLSRETLTAGGRVAVVDEAMCTGCLTCVRICPFNVPIIKPNLTGIGSIMGAAHIEAAICQGCGSCAAECPAQAIQLMHYTNDQMIAKVSALLQPDPGFIILDDIKILE